MTTMSDLDYQRHLVELKLRHASEVYGYASTYDNAVVIAGYAAFFGLWAGISDDVTQLCRVTTASVMGMSLLLYVVWHIMQMLHRQSFELEQANAFELENDPPVFLERWEDIKRRRDASWIPLIRIWRPLFTASVALGMAGAIILIWNAAMLGLGLPLQLTG